MNPLTTTRRRFLALATAAAAWAIGRTSAQTADPHPPGGSDTPPPRGGGGGRRQHRAVDYVVPADLSRFAALSIVLGRVTDRSITLSALSKAAAQGFYEYGSGAGDYSQRSEVFSLAPSVPQETEIKGLSPSTEYHYRLRLRDPGVKDYSAGPEGSFHTQRARGEAFTFAIQGDSHPERPNMSDAALYARTLVQVAASRPDFHICMGDDFSVDTLHTVNAETVAQRYALQRPFLGIVGESSPVYLLNGNHEQASLFNFRQSDIRHSVAVWAQTARNRLFPTIAPDGFYTGNQEPLASIGALKDYYAWEWGDALFVVLDNYWHSPAQVDSPLFGDDGGHGKGADKKNHDGWATTLGDAQYEWFKATLERSTARYKFVFAHHVLGTGRGGVEWSDSFEWGGRNRRGEWEFAQKRPNWTMPIHPLMVKHGVTIFFQGHDHLFVTQERDGIIYQEVPMPADPGYQAYNEEHYRTGTKLPNSGHLRVSVSTPQVKVDYVRTYLPKDERPGAMSGQVAHSYTVLPKHRDA